VCREWGGRATSILHRHVNGSHLLASGGKTSDAAAGRGDARRDRADCRYKKSNRWGKFWLCWVHHPQPESGVSSHSACSLLRGSEKNSHTQSLIASSSSLSNSEHLRTACFPNCRFGLDISSASSIEQLYALLSDTPESSRRWGSSS
jgi:hypothetical protein